MHVTAVKMQKGKKEGEKKVTQVLKKTGGEVPFGFPRGLVKRQSRTTPNLNEA